MIFWVSSLEHITHSRSWKLSMKVYSLLKCKPMSRLKMSLILMSCFARVSSRCLVLLECEDAHEWYTETGGRRVLDSCKVQIGWSLKYKEPLFCLFIHQLVFDIFSWVYAGCGSSHIYFFAFWLANSKLKSTRGNCHGKFLLFLANMRIIMCF